MQAQRSIYVSAYNNYIWAIISNYPFLIEANYNFEETLDT